MRAAFLYTEAGIWEEGPGEASVRGKCKGVLRLGAGTQYWSPVGPLMVLNAPQRTLCKSKRGWVRTGRGLSPPAPGMVGGDGVFVFVSLRQVLCSSG